MQIWLTVFSIVLSFLLACQCSRYAKRKGRDSSVWFMAGAFFGLFALLLLLLLPAKKAPVPVAPPAPKEPFLALSDHHVDKFWYFLDENKKQYGPMSFTALKSAWNTGSIQSKTFVWNEEMEEWKPLSEAVRFH